MRIDSSGNVGIGTVSPTQKLEVSGRVLGDSLSAASAVYIWSQNRMSLGASVGIESQQNSPLFMLTQGVAQPIVFGTNSTERMRIDSSGRLLVGTTAVTTSSSQSGEVYSSGSTGFLMTNTTAANYALSVKNEGTSGTRNLINFLEGTAGGTSRANISLDGSNNLTVTPVNSFYVNKSTTGVVARFTGSTDGGRGLAFTSADNGEFLGAIWDYNVLSASGIHKWSINSTERMRIASNGYVGIGTTAPSTYLQIDGTHVSGYGLLALNAASGTQYTSLSFSNNGTPRAFIFYDNTNNLLNVYGTAGRAVTITTNDTERMRIDSSGRVGIGATTPASRFHVRQNTGGTDNDNDCVGQFILGDSSTYGSILFVKNAGNRGTRANPDGSGLLTLAFSNATALAVDKSGNLSFDSGYGGAAVAYGCRAWVNFDGQANPPSIRGSGNVSSITDLGTGRYRTNLINSLPDTNYAIFYNDWSWGVGYTDSQTTSSFVSQSLLNNFGAQDVAIIWLAAFR